MKIIDLIKKIFGRFNSEVPKLEESNIDLEQVEKNAGERKEFVDSIKFEQESYKTKLDEMLEQAQRNPLAVGLDFEEILVGAVLEEKGASEELMKLFTNSKVCSADYKYWESSLGAKFDQFVVPANNNNPKYTVEAINKRIQELKEQINISSDKNSFFINGEYNEPMEQRKNKPKGC